MTGSNESMDLESVLARYENGALLPRQEISHLLTRYGERLGIDSLQLDEAGTAGLCIDGRINVALAHLPQFAGLVIMLEMTDLAVSDPLLRKRLLQANLDWSRTAGGSFAAIPGQCQVVLLRLIHLVDDDLDRIDHELAMLVEFVGELNDELETEALVGESRPGTDGLAIGLIRA
ncbi:MAG: CesT family type III secretion system chaperone [Pseudomonadota bacterium]